MTTNSDFARHTAEVADALADYDHLPHIGLISTFASGSTYLCPDAAGHAGVRLGLVMSPAGNEVSAEQLLAALHVDQDVPAVTHG